MVLLTYQTETVLRENVPTGKDAVGKSEGSPKTAYIDKLYSFNEDYPDEERCDLFFICQDGEIPAHRLVISHASKYIMAMQDDQPPWYPVYISVPDLTKEIVNTLVRLAYTGQMNITPGTTHDELLDAMQALGWVHTDCLTATYLDSSNASADEDFGVSPVSSKAGESLETVLKMNFPAAAKGETEASDDEDEMEVALPDVPMSDEEGKLEIDLDSPKKRGSPTKRTRQTKAKQPKTQTPSKPKLATPLKRNQSPKQTVETPKPSEISASARKGSRRNNEDAAVTASASKEPELPVPANSVVEGDSEPLRSRTRTIRKPKKFDDLIVLTPTKRKESPTKSPSKPPPKKTSETGKETVAVTKTTKGAVVKKASTDVNPISTGSKNHSRRSTSTDSKDSPRNSLITSYFNKQSPRQSKDTALQGTKGGVKELTEENNVQSADSDVEEISKTPSSENTGDNNVDTKKQENSTSSTRSRAKSTASSKDGKEPSPDDTNADTVTSSKTRRKRSTQDNSVEDSTEAINPVKRGRKPSTVSNASKSSNREHLQENDLEGNAAESPRTRRSRQE